MHSKEPQATGTKLIGLTLQLYATIFWNIESGE